MFDAWEKSQQASVFIDHLATVYQDPPPLNCHEATEMLKISGVFDAICAQISEDSECDRNLAISMLSNFVLWIPKEYVHTIIYETTLLKAIKRCMDREKSRLLAFDLLSATCYRASKFDTLALEKKQRESGQALLATLADDGDGECNELSDMIKTTMFTYLPRIRRESLQKDSAFHDVSDELVQLYPHIFS